MGGIYLQWYIGDAFRADCWQHRKRRVAASLGRFGEGILELPHDPGKSQLVLFVRIQVVSPLLAVIGEW